MNIAILGIGTVGSGVLKVLQDNQEMIQERLGEPIKVTHIFGRTIHNYHNCELTGIKHVQNLNELLHEDIDVVVEVTGGIDFAYNVHQQFLSHGIHVVSANKDMLAIHIDELAAIGNAYGAQLAYEATTAGGIPIISSLQYGLNANRVTRLAGIFNGTTNYILTKMTQEGLDYNTALKEAQLKGFAEADPTNDVDGLDAQRKITLLSRLAYNRKIDLAEVTVTGIRDIEPEDIKIAQDNGYIIKLLGSSEFDGRYLEIGVEPTLIPSTHQLSSVHEAMNGVFINGDAIGEAMFYGPGAGSLETASAIVSDVMNIAEFGFVGNFLPEEEAVIAPVYPKQSYFIRFEDDEKTVKNSLKERQIKFRVLKAGEYFAVETEALTYEDIEELATKVGISTAYSILRNETTSDLPLETDLCSAESAVIASR